MFCLQSSTSSYVNHNTTIKIRKLMLIHFYHSVLGLHSGFASCPVLLLLWNRSIEESHCILFSSSLSLEQFLSLFWAFMAFEDVGQLFCIMFSHFGIPKKCCSVRRVLLIESYQILHGFDLYQYSWCQSLVQVGVCQIALLQSYSLPPRN